MHLNDGTEVKAVPLGARTMDRAIVGRRYIGSIKRGRSSKSMRRNFRGTRKAVGIVPSPGLLTQLMCELKPSIQ